MYSSVHLPRLTTFWTRLKPSRTRQVMALVRVGGRCRLEHKQKCLRINLGEHRANNVGKDFTEPVRPRIMLSFRPAWMSTHGNLPAQLASDGSRNFRGEPKETTPSILHKGRDESPSEFSGRRAQDEDVVYPLWRDRSSTRRSTRYPRREDSFIIDQKAWRGEIHDYLKTENGNAKLIFQ
jgi:hypothetical protein